MTEDDRGSGARTIALLKIVADSGATFTLTQLGARAELPPSSVHRLLQPLIRAGMVERGPGQAYRVGSEFHRVASLIMQQVDPGRLAEPILRRLWSQWEETCSLCIYKPSSHTAVVVATIQTPHPLRFMIEPHTELSLSWGSLGRAILASLPDVDAIEAMKKHSLGPLSGQAMPSAAQMTSIIEKVREEGVAHYRNEEMDVAGVAAPVFRADGTVLGSLGVTAPARRLHVDVARKIEGSVKEAACELSALLGNKGIG